jgi:hypothetical protein
MKGTARYREWENCIMRDEGDMLNPPRYTSWGIAWRICAGILVVYVLLVGALVLTHG